MRNKLLIPLVALFLSISCNDSLVYSEYRKIEDAKWPMDLPLKFELPPLDPGQDYRMFLNLRNDNTYPFSNLFLITALESPSGEVRGDTLEFRMADPTGAWLGQGRGSLVEHKLWYLEKIVFPDSGVYKLTVSHAMRINGEVEGLSVLEGITDLGLEIEKAPN